LKAFHTPAHNPGVAGRNFHSTTELSFGTNELIAALRVVSYGSECSHIQPEIMLYERHRREEVLRD